MIDRLDYAIASLRRAAENGYPWSVLPAEAAALVEEIERLRHIVADQQMMLDEHRLDNMHAFQEGGEGERAAVVAWLEELSASSLHHDPVAELQYAARSIGRGEHRREETR